MKRITPSMIAKGGKRYCCFCKRPPEGFSNRVEATWIHRGEPYCDQHKPNPTPMNERLSEADYQTWMRL
jgi:hypothetical protein